MLKKVYVDGFVFLPLHIYKRHLSPPVRKMRPIPNPLRILPSFQTKHFKYLYSNKYTLLNLIFGKYLEPRKKLTRFAWSKPLQKCWTNLTKVRPLFTLSHRGSDNSRLQIVFMWTLYELCSCIYYVMISTNQIAYFKQCSIF